MRRIPKSTRRAARPSFVAIDSFESLEPRVVPSLAGSFDLMIEFAPGVSSAAQQAVLSSVGGVVVQTLPGRTEAISLPAFESPSAMIHQLQNDPGVVYVETDASIRAASITPNDPYFSQQWGLSNTNGTGIDAPRAWTVTTGAPTVVAVLDTGVDFASPDLSGQLWTNPNLAADAATYPGDVNGWNFVSNNANVQDDNGHGSHVSGIIAASGNNGTGVTGVDWGARLMEVKVLDSNGNGTTDEAASGIYFAVAHGATVINASWGGGTYSQTLYNAINYAGQHGVVFVTAAGNNGTNTDTTPSYPGSYRLPNEIVVAATDQNGNLASFSDFGATTVDIAAPGVNIWSTVPGGYAQYSGTSMATPYVTGVVALIQGLAPSASPAQVINQVLSTAKPLPGLAGLVVTGGIVDAANAVGALLPGANFAATQAASSGSTPIGLQSEGSTNLVAGATSPSDLQASILASPEFLNKSGGTAQDYVNALYQTLLGRPADPSGLASWVAQLAGGATRYDVARLIEWSPEALATKVARWYQTDLGRTASLATLKNDVGVRSWAAMLSSCVADNAVRAQILGSNEAVAHFGGTSTSFVNGLYQDLLGRAADSAGLAYWSGLIANGAAPSNVVAAIEASIEAAQTKVAGWYQADLGRTASIATLKQDSGVDFWANMTATT